MDPREKSWKEVLRNPDLRPLEPEVFRHELHAIGASSIAQQYYCEAKVEQGFINGEIPSEVREIGTSLHSEILSMERVEIEELIEDIETAPRLVASFRLHGLVGRLRVVGVPDALIFEKGIPEWVVELKTTRGDTSKVWKDQLMQVRIYGLLLERMGFDCSRLKLALVKVKQAGKELDPVMRKTLLSEIQTALRSEGQRKRRELESMFSMRFFVYPHVASEAERGVAWAQDYWLRERDPIPSTSAAKCRACEYSIVCPYSLFKPKDEEVE